MALLDMLRKRMSSVQKPATQAADVGALESQITAGQTGRVQQATGPAASGIGSQLAAQQAQAQQEALTSQQQQATEQLAGQIALGEEGQALAEKGLEQQRGQALSQLSAQGVMAAEQREAREDLKAMELEAKSSMFADKMTNAFANHLKDLATERGIAEQDMFAAFNREQQSLSADKAAARLHQLGHVLALSDRQYVDTIMTIAKEENLRDELEFKQTSYELIMGKDLELMQDRMDFQAALNMDAREFKKEMFNMDMDTAMELAEIAAKEANYIQAVQGLSGIAKGGMNMYMSGLFEGGGDTFTTGSEQAAQQSLVNRYSSGSDPFGAPPSSSDYFTANTPRDYSSFDSWINYGGSD